MVWLDQTLKDYQTPSETNNRDVIFVLNNLVTLVVTQFRDICAPNGMGESNGNEVEGRDT